MGVSVIGAGNVGLALARALVAKGETVVFGVSDPGKYRDSVARFGGSASVSTVDVAVAANEIVILATPYKAALSIASSITDWQNKILVDATNPIAGSLEGLAVGTTSSGAEEVALAAKGARVVKAFNTTGAENMADSRYPSGIVFMPVCGDDAEARNKIVALANLIGFDAVDMGTLKSARYLEPFAMTWIHLAIKMGQGRNSAFCRITR